eukprot:754457-Hanusia_phi.AAC.3
MSLSETIDTIRVIHTSRRSEATKIATSSLTSNRRSLLQSLQIVNDTNECPSLQTNDMCWSNTTVVWEISAALAHYSRIKGDPGWHISYWHSLNLFSEELKIAMGPMLRLNPPPSSLHRCPYDDEHEVQRNRRLYNHGFELTMKLHLDLLFNRP